MDASETSFDMFARDMFAVTVPYEPIPENVWKGRWTDITYNSIMNSHSLITSTRCLSHISMIYLRGLALKILKSKPWDVE